MKAIERLKRDHMVLRARLNVIEAALRMGPETWLVVREVCHTLTRQLRDHIRREDALVAASRRALPEDRVTRLSTEHGDEPRLLGSINRMLLREGGRSMEEISRSLYQFVDGLRQHLDEEEAGLFPSLEMALQQPGVGETEPSLHAGPGHESMTVNSVVLAFPATRAVFERLFVNIPLEGTDCLDEVAWRRGLEGRELVELLEQAIARTSAHVVRLEPGHPMASCSN